MIHARTPTTPTEAKVAYNSCSTWNSAFEFVEITRKILLGFGVLSFLCWASYATLGLIGLIVAFSSSSSDCTTTTAQGPPCDDEEDINSHLGGFIAFLISIPCSVGLVVYLFIVFQWSNRQKVFEVSIPQSSPSRSCCGLFRSSCAWYAFAFCFDLFPSFTCLLLLVAASASEKVRVLAGVGLALCAFNAVLVSVGYYLVSTKLAALLENLLVLGHISPECQLRLRGCGPPNTDEMGESTYFLPLEERNIIPQWLIRDHRRSTGSVNQVDNLVSSSKTSDLSGRPRQLVLPPLQVPAPIMWVPSPQPRSSTHNCPSPVSMSRFSVMRQPPLPLLHGNERRRNLPPTFNSPF